MAGGDMRRRAFDIRHRDRKALREGYSPAVRRFEIASIALYCCAMGCFLVVLLPLVGTYPWLMASAFMFGFVLADFVSGIVHWAADTWGSPDMPVIGQALIRPFREHHVDQKEITRHDFIETNGNNCFISIGPAVCGALLPADWFFLSAMGFAACFAIFGTNQFHKWSHLDEPPAAVRLL